MLSNHETQMIRGQVMLTNPPVDLQHTLFLLTWDHALHVAPLDKPPTRVLDAGCGTGIWAVEFGKAPLHSRL